MNYQDPIPLVLLIAVAIQRARLQSKGKFRLLRHPLWPQAEDPGLAMQLAPSAAFMDELLGEAETETGNFNRATLIAVQRADYLFIQLYTLFLLAAAVLDLRNPWRSVAIFLTLLTGIADYAEDRAIVRMASGQPGAPPRRFGQFKWAFYFLTILAETPGIFSLARAGPLETALLCLFAGALALAGAGGFVAAVRGGFSGISSAAKLSGFGLLGLALAPFIEHPPGSLHVAAEYLSLLRVPLLTGLLLAALPLLAFFTGAGSLLKGLFDVTPGGMLMLTLAAAAASGTVADNARIVYLHAWQRFPGLAQPPDASSQIWLWITLGASLPIVVSAFIFSVRQKHPIAGLTASVAAGLAAAAGTVSILEVYGPNIARFLWSESLERPVVDWMVQSGLFAGYVTNSRKPVLDLGIWEDHLTAFAGFMVTAALYAVLGIYGRRKLGREGTVPALCSALMLLMMVCWSLSSLAFFFDEWRVPLLLLVLIAGTLTAQSRHSDHFYGLRRRASPFPPPDPVDTIRAARRRRVIAVAANGGGIQAGAWAAQVLEGLHNLCGAEFSQAVRLISSVSGGSLGNACYVNWLADSAFARTPFDAASESSLDEVSWGLSWPDFLRGLCPWLFGWFIGRGRALEKAWCLNSANDPDRGSHLDLPLSDWNERVAKGDLPAVVMNATVSETGERLLLATTHLTHHHHAGKRARIDADDLHFINGERLDVAVVTAARLSASFPYVTPAARSDGAGLQPHIVDGGYYDNYGMATLTEWLDEALSGTRPGEVESVLVLQIHGAPVTEDDAAKRHSMSRGWFYQAIAPLTTLFAVRSAGQIAHNDIELELLQDKWSAAGVPVHAVLFEFPNPDAPLSWHLTQSDKERIRQAWQNNMGPCRTTVQEFLRGDRKLKECRCPVCLHNTVTATG
jgi:hypothetical protein